MQTGKTLEILKNIHEDNHDPEDKLMVIQNMLDAETHNKITKSDLLEILRWIVEEYLRGGLT